MKKAAGAAPETGKLTIARYTPGQWNAHEIAQKRFSQCQLIRRDSLVVAALAEVALD